MNENNSNLTFEERMKNQRVKRKKAFFIKLCSIITTFLLLAIYFMIPFSHASNCQVHGTKYYSKEQIFTIAGISENDSLYTLDGNKIKENLSSSPLIGKDVKVTITPIGMSIQIEENYPFCYYEDSHKKYYLNDGNLLGEDLINSSDELVGEFIKSNLDKAIKFNFEPSKQNIDKRNYNSIVSIVSNISSDKKKLISCIGYNKASNSVAFYIDGENDEVYKFNLQMNTTFYVEGGYKLFDLDLKNLALDSISKGKVNTVEDNKKVYSWDVIIQENSNSYKFILNDTKETN